MAIAARGKQRWDHVRSGGLQPGVRSRCGLRSGNMNERCSPKAYMCGITVGHAPRHRHTSSVSTRRPGFFCGARLTAPRSMAVASRAAPLGEERGRLRAATRTTCWALSRRACGGRRYCDVGGDGRGFALRGRADAAAQSLQAITMPSCTPGLNHVLTLQAPIGDVATRVGGLARQPRLTSTFPASFLGPARPQGYPYSLPALSQPPAPARAAGRPEYDVAARAGTATRLAGRRPPRRASQAAGSAAAAPGERLWLWAALEAKPGPEGGPRPALSLQAIERGKPSSLGARRRGPSTAAARRRCRRLWRASGLTRRLPPPFPAPCSRPRCRCPSACPRLLFLHCWEAWAALRRLCSPAVSLPCAGWLGGG